MTTLRLHYALFGRIGEPKSSRGVLDFGGSEGGDTADYQRQRGADSVKESGWH